MKKRFLDQNKFKNNVKYGDMIINHHASKSNPRRKGYFVGFINYNKTKLNNGNYIQLTTDLRKNKGDFWEVAFDSR